jgi:hypothetical protein
MTDRNQFMTWRAILRGVAIVYGTTFLAGLVFAFNGITPQTDHIVYSLLALLTGAVGVAIALRVAGTTRLSYLVAVGVGVWLLNSTSVLLGAQSLTGWVNSSVFIAATVILGRLLIGVNVETFPTPATPYLIASKRSYSALRKRRARPSHF